MVADVDAGNRGYPNRNGDGSALSLDWSPRADGDPGAPADPAAWFDRHLAGCKLAILDTGANMLAAANPISSFIGGLIQLAKSRGTRIIVYGVTSPHKPRSDELAEAMYQRFHRAAEVVVVQNDRDGSNAFAASPHRYADRQAASSGVRSPGSAPRRRIPLDEVLVRPDPGYERTTALIAHRLLAAAKQDAVIDVAGNGVVTALEALAVARPTTWHHRIARLDQTMDVAITANERTNERTNASPRPGTGFAGLTGARRRACWQLRSNFATLTMDMAIAPDLWDDRLSRIAWPLSSIYAGLPQICFAGGYRQKPSERNDPIPAFGRQSRRLRRTIRTVGI